MNDNKIKGNRPLSFRAGVIIFLIVIVSLIVIGAPLQLYFGLYGVAATELMFAVIAVAAALILKADFKEAFPLSLPPPRAFIGGMLMYVGVYPLMLAVIETTDYIFPLQITEIADSFVTVGSSLAPFATLIIMAVLPALCEELLHRGILLSCFKSLGREWLTVLIAGLAFGLFHLDPYRLLSTALLGALFAYIALKTHSMLIGMILHFMTNAVSVYAIFTLADTDTVEAEAIAFTPSSLVGEWLMYTGIAIPLLYFGRALVIGKRSSLRISAAVIAAGVLLTALGAALRY